MSIRRASYQSESFGVWHDPMNWRNPLDRTGTRTVSLLEFMNAMFYKIVFEFPCEIKFYFLPVWDRVWIFKFSSLEKDFIQSGYYNNFSQTLRNKMWPHQKLETFAEIVNLQHTDSVCIPYELAYESTVCNEHWMGVSVGDNRATGKQNPPSWTPRGRRWCDSPMFPTQ